MFYSIHIPTHSDRLANWAGGYATAADAWRGVHELLEEAFGYEGYGEAEVAEYDVVFRA